MKTILITLLLSLTLFVHGQQDSTEIKLQHYKDLFLKGLINAKDYEELKQKELGLNPTPEAKTTAQPTETPKETVQSKPNKKKFDIDSVKLGFTDIIELGPVIGLQTTAPAALFGFKNIMGKQVSAKTFWGAGICFEVSSYQSKKTSNYTIQLRDNYLLNGKATFTAISGIAAFRHSFLRKRVSPFIGVDLGATYYSMRIPKSSQTSVVTYTDDGYSSKGGGARLGVDVGFKGYVSQKVALGLSLNYLFQHFQIPRASGQQVDGNLIKGTEAKFYHFLGINFILSFS